MPLQEVERAAQHVRGHVGRGTHRCDVRTDGRDRERRGRADLHHTQLDAVPRATCRPGSASVTITAVGARGGIGGGQDGPGPAGAGATVTATVTVRPCTQLDVWVGSAGRRCADGRRVGISGGGGDGSGVATHHRLLHRRGARRRRGRRRWRGRRRRRSDWRRRRRGRALRCGSGRDAARGASLRARWWERCRRRRWRRRWRHHHRRRGRRPHRWHRWDRKRRPVVQRTARDDLARRAALRRRGRRRVPERCELRRGRWRRLRRRRWRWRGRDADHHRDRWRGRRWRELRDHRCDRRVVQQRRHRRRIGHARVRGWLGAVPGTTTTIPTTRLPRWRSRRRPPSPAEGRRYSAVGSLQSTPSAVSRSRTGMPGVTTSPRSTRATSSPSAAHT